MVAHDFKAVAKNEISVKKGMTVSVVQKSINGWWFVETKDGSSGFVPKGALNVSGSEDDVIRLETRKSEKFYKK